MVASSTGRPEALGPRFKSKWERDADKKARQQAEAAQANRKRAAQLRAEAVLAMELARVAASDAHRADHIEAGPEPIEEFCHIEYEDGTEYGIHSGILHDPDNVATLSSTFAGWLQTRTGHPLELVKTPIKDALEALRSQMWRGQPIGERRYEAVMLKDAGKSIPQIASIMRVNEKTVDRYLGYVRNYLARVGS